MANRKQLKNIALGLLGTFASRNNDVDGYWGLGVLRSLAVCNGLEEITLDLTGDSSQPLSPEPVRSIEKRYQHWFCNALRKIGVDPSSLREARVSVRFTTFDEFPKAVRNTWGDPYICTAIIALNDGKSAEASTMGVCAVHDATRELRSTRVS